MSLAWFAVGTAVYLGAGLASLFGWSYVLSSLGLRAEAGTSGWGLHLAGWIAVWGALAALALAVLAFRFARGFTPRRSRALALLVSGLAFASATQFILHEWTRSRFGDFDLEYVAASGGLPAVLVAIAVASWATVAAPVEVRPAPAAALAASVILFWAIGLSNLPGAANGLTAAGIPLAGLLVAAGAFSLIAVAVTAAATRRWR